MTQDTQLARCPFCGHYAQPHARKFYYISCNGCEVQSPLSGIDDNTPDDVIMWWNRRAESAELDRLRQQVAELEAQLAEQHEKTLHYHAETTGIVANLTRENEQLKAQHAAASQWQPVLFVHDGGDHILADDIAVTIASNDMAMATFAWPDDGHEYRLFRRTPAPGE